MIYDLPQSIEIGGTEHEIRTDYRDILNIILALSDNDLEPEEKQFVCLYVLYKDFGEIKSSDYEEAVKKAFEFIDCGLSTSDKKHPRTMDWEQDAALIFPAVNHEAGCDVRSVPYMHWWTFMGLFMEIKGTTYATVLNLRGKKAKGKKLEKTEQEFWAANKDICVLKEKLTEEEIKEKERLIALLDGK